MSQLASDQPNTTLSEPANFRKAHIENLENNITELTAHIHAATYRLLQLIREYDESMGWAGPGLNSCAHWLNWKCGINLGAAREKVRVAHALNDLPGISDAFKQGKLSYSKVRAMTRVATRENEDYLLMIARHGTAAHVERLVRQYRKVKRVEALSLENKRHELRELSWFEDADGSIVLRGRLTPEHGALVIKALDCAQDELFEESKHVAEQTQEEGLTARPEPIATRRADALVRMAEGFLADSTKPTSADRYLVHVHTDLETLKAGGSGAQSELEDGGNVSAETSRRLSCDAGVVHWLADHKGEPLSVGRKTRSVPPSIRRALQRRDGGCRFPGCTCRRFVDAHHIRHWSDGGETCLDNLVLLCRRHHRLVHEGGFGVRLAAGGAIDFTDPSGVPVPGNGETRFRGNVVDLVAENGRSGTRITPRTGTSRWLGEQMDDDLAVLGLLQLE